MKMLRRIVTVIVAISITSGVLIVALRGLPQAQAKPPHDITISDWKELKSPYDKDGARWENEILKKHSKSYCVHHNVDKSSKPTHHHTSDMPCPGATQTDDSQSEIIPVQNTSPTAHVNIITGVNVTQQISCDTADDQTAILATFK